MTTFILTDDTHGPLTTPERPPLALADAQALKVGLIRAEFASRLAAGLSYQGQHVAIDDGSRANLAACGLKALQVAVAGAAWPPLYSKGWITIEGGRIPLPSATDGDALAEAASTYYAGLAQHGQDLEEQVGAVTTTAADVLAIDHTVGWPANTSTAPSGS